MGATSYGEWLRIPLRAPGPIRYQSERDSYVEGHWIPSGTLVGGYHCTLLRSLVEEHPYAPGSKGILNESEPGPGQTRLRRPRLRYGSCTHQSRRGVNFYAIPPVWLGDWGEEVAEEKRWCMLEISVVDTCVLKGGAAHRYCATIPHGNDPGDMALKTVINAIFVYARAAPTLVQLT